MTISYSQLSLYSRCPYQYYCKYLEGMDIKETEAQLFGQEFHEKIFKEEDADEQTKRMQLALWESKDFQKIAPQIRKLEVEEKAYVEGYNYYARYDALSDDHIIEFKTARKEWTKEDFEESLQPHLYMKIRQKSGKKWNFIYFIVTKHKKPRVQVKEIKFNNKKWKEIKDLSQAMMQDFSYNKITGQHCYYCPFQNHCEKWF